LEKESRFKRGETKNLSLPPLLKAGALL